MKRFFSGIRRKYASIVWKLRISFALIIMFFILLITVLCRTAFKTIFYEREIENFNSRIELADIACGDLISNAQQFSKLLLLSEEVQDYFGIEESSSYAQQIKRERAVEIRFDYVEGSKRSNEFSMLAVFSQALESGVFSNSLSSVDRQSFENFYDENISHTSSAVWLYIPRQRSGGVSDTCLCYASPYFDFNTGRQIGHLVIYYDIDSLKHLLHPVLTSSVAEYTILADDSIILSSEDASSDLNSLIAETGADSSAISKTAQKHGYWSECHTISGLPLTVVSYEPESVILSDADTMVRMILPVGLLCIILGIIAATFISDSFTRPISALAQTMERFGRGESVRVEKIRNDEIGILQNSFNTMSHQITRLVTQVYEEQRNRRKFELNALQAQINPHFLYNTLNSICSLIVIKDNSGAYRMITNLSSFYRTALSSGNTLIPLSDELKNVESYLKIQSIRHSGSFTWTVRTDPSISQQRIVKLTLQPLVENSLLHGFDKSTVNPHILITCVKERQDQINITVHDNGRGIPPEKQEHLFDRNIDKFGLYSVRERLRLYFKDRADMTVAGSPGEGTTFVITLPTSDH